MKTVSVVVPCMNELEYIRKFIYSIFNQDYPKHLIEIIIADGMSTDGTRDILNSFNDFRLKLIDNTDKYVSTGLNEAIMNSTGEIIMRMDVHCIYPSNYISVLIKHLLIINK